MPEKFSGVKCEDLTILQPVLKEWINCNQDLLDCWGGDLPWWYNERASVSVLAGAAWRLGYRAFEEFSEDKRQPNKRHPTYHGRIDLYLNVKCDDFIAEAKYFWSAATRVTPRTSETLEAWLGEACEGIKKCPKHGQHKLGILFAQPYIAKAEKQRVDELLQQWIAAMLDVDCSCRAWVFPQATRLSAGTVSICPGAAVLIKEV